MLDSRIMYVGLIRYAADVKSLMDRLPDDTVEINMIETFPIPGHKNAVNIRPWERDKRLTIESIKIPEGATMIDRNPRGAVLMFSYANGHYRFLEEKPKI